MRLFGPGVIEVTDAKMRYPNKLKFILYEEECLLTLQKNIHQFITFIDFYTGHSGILFT
jgi:hypothetical protein